MSVENAALLQDLEECREGSAEAMKMVRDVIENGKLTRVKEVQSFMTAFGRLHFWREALELLELKRTGEWPVGDIVLTNAAMKACGRVGNWELVLGLLEDAPKHKVSPDIISYNLAMASCCNARQWERVLTLLNDIPSVKELKEATFNVTLHACVQGGQWELGLASLNQMLESDLQPTWTMYNLGILLAGPGGLWQTACGYLQDMWRKVVLPEAMTYASVASVCGEAQQWQQVKQLVAEMRRKGFGVPPETLELLERAERAEVPG